MPYLSDTARFEDLDEAIDTVIEKLDGRTNAVFNYTLSRIAGARVMQCGIHATELSAHADAAEHLDAEACDAIRQHAEGNPDLGYETRAEVYGSVMAFVGEFKRRILDRYEDTKVYTRQLRDDANPDLPEYDALDSR